MTTAPAPSQSEIADETTTPTRGSGVGGAVFNFTNSIVGAGAIGLGGAIAVSGGFVSIALILLFAILTKLSLDLVISLSLFTTTTTVSAAAGENNNNNSNSMEGGTYEALGNRAYGSLGVALVLSSKMLYSFGCLVAYVVVVKDNFGSAVTNLLFHTSKSNDDEHNAGGDNHSWFQSFLEHSDWVAWILSATVILPLCLLRNMTPLANLSLVSVSCMVLIVVIIIYLFIVNPQDIRNVDDTDFYDHWFALRPGVMESLGTFVFSFVSQHTVHLAYFSLDSSIRTYDTWTKVSSYALTISTVVSLSVGLFVYMTFWDQTESDLFDMYPSNLKSIQAAKLLLCITMLLTFPLPFFTCREMVIVAVKSCMTSNEDEESGHALPEEPTIEQGESDLQQPLLSSDDDDEIRAETSDQRPRRRDERDVQPEWMFISDRQLQLPFHIAITVMLWLLATVLAVMAPSLGAVLDLVGCATGTVMAFILPALFSFRLRGYSHLALVILAIGGFVGVVGTAYSVQNLILGGIGR